MKPIIFTLLFFGALAAQAQEKQSLKDLLYGGKLKKDSSGVIRSTDDLSAKIDTSTKKEPEVAKPQVAAVPDKTQPSPAVDSKSPAATATPSSDVAETSTVTPAAPAGPAKTNTRLWKEYNDSLQKILKAEVLGAKQIKKNTYFLMVDYEIDTDGQVSFTNVSSTPENAYLQAQVKQVLDSTPLRLNPVTDSSNQAKKVKKKQQISVTKD